jgi:hypothetical protein
MQLFLHTTFKYTELYKIRWQTKHMGLRRHQTLVVFSVRETREILIAIAKERLTSKQKKILQYLYLNKSSNSVTYTVNILSANFLCSKTAVWNNIRSLRKAYLLLCGDLNNKNIPLNLTKPGLYIAENL